MNAREQGRPRSWAVYGWTMLLSLPVLYVISSGPAQRIPAKTWVGMTHVEQETDRVCRAMPLDVPFPQGATSSIFIRRWPHPLSRFYAPLNFARRLPVVESCLTWYWDLWPRGNLLLWRGPFAEIDGDEFFLSCTFTSR